MSSLTLVLIGLLIWLLLLVAIMLVFVFRTRPRQRRQADRRRVMDRRTGLPDPRPVPIERRRGPDRRQRGIAA